MVGICFLIECCLCLLPNCCLKEGKKKSFHKCCCLLARDSWYLLQLKSLRTMLVLWPKYNAFNDFSFCIHNKPSQYMYFHLLGKKKKTFSKPHSHKIVKMHALFQTKELHPSWEPNIYICLGHNMGVPPPLP